MRTPLLVVGLSGVLGACGDDAGAILVLQAPEGPATAARLEIVLANAAEDRIARDIDQRIEPSSLDEAPVTYYRQRASGGDAMAVEVLDGFSVRIEPELAVAADEEFVPFLLVRDAQGEVIAVGTVDDEDGAPYAIDVNTNKRVEYVTTVRPVANPAAKHGLRAIGRTITCGSNADRFASGIVWRPERGPELRLLLATPSQTDASERALDLDCDHVAADAPERDCDDVDAGTYTGAEETCDGFDTDCDGEEPRIVACDLDQPTLCNGTNIATGVQTCETSDGTPRTSTCVPGPTCECPDGDCNSHRCTVGAETISNGTFTTCSPATGALQLCTGAGCTVTVDHVDPGLELTISATEAGPYSHEIVATKVHLRLEDVTFTRPVPANGNKSLGAAILSIDNPATATVSTYVVRFKANDNVGCAEGPGQTSLMSCEP